MCAWKAAAWAASTPPSAAMGVLTNTITISANETTGMVTHPIHNDGHQEADTTDQVRATVRDPDAAGAYTYDNTNAPTFMVSNDDFNNPPRRRSLR